LWSGPEPAGWRAPAPFNVTCFTSGPGFGSY